MTTWRTAGIALLALASSAGASFGQNLPPIAVAEAAPGPARPGVAIQFVGSNSSDPDAGPAPLTYSWDFGDGATSDVPDPQHVFSERGLFTVSLRVFDGRTGDVDSLLLGVLEAPVGPAPRASSSLVVSEDGATAWVVGEDAGTVSAVDTAALSLIEEVAVCAGPVSIALMQAGATVAVACRDEGRVVLLDAATRAVTDSVLLGGEPRGLVARPGSAELAVAVRGPRGEGQLVLLDPADPMGARRIVLGGRPRAVAVTGDGLRAVVTDFLAGAGTARAFLLDLANVRVDREVLLGPDPSIDSSSSGRGLPNLLGSVAIEPSGRLAHVGGLKSNVFRGLVRDGQPLRATNRVRGLVAPLELATGLERPDWRFDLNDADSGAALAFSPDGRHLFVAHQGTGELSTYDVLAPTIVDPFDGSAVPRAARIAVGEAPRGLALAGDVLWVHVALDRGVAAVDVSEPTAPRVVAFVQTETETLSPGLLNGKRLFHRSRRPVHSSEGYVACASCHPEGGHDGQTWDFTDGGEGLRNTTDLRGRGGTAHGPVHWSANFDEIQDFENDIVNAFGGTGLAQDGEPPHPPLDAPNGGRSVDLDDLALYVADFDTAPESPWRDPGAALSAAADRGRILFHSVETGCATCHLPPRFTDSTLAGGPEAFRLHDVGTLGPESGSRLGGPLTGLDTPTLKGLWDGAPYLHDGRAVTLREVLVDWNAGERHGRTLSLSAGELDDLVAFLLSIDEGADLGPDAPSSLPGEVGRVEGTGPLLLSKAGSQLRLRWGAVAEAATYVVSRGRLGDFDVHLADGDAGACDTGGETQLFDPDDLGDSANHFYLVAGRNALGEGTPGLGRALRTGTAECP